VISNVVMPESICSCSLFSNVETRQTVQQSVDYHKLIGVARLTFKTRKSRQTDNVSMLKAFCFVLMTED